MKTKFLGKRKPTEEEKKKGAEIVFLRQDQDANEIKILAAKCHESWEQWGAHEDILYDNVETVEKWRSKQK
jgi:hypothetical protein